MSRKSGRRTPRGKSAPIERSPADLEREAREHLAGGRHREAIAGFKQLLKQEPRPAWRCALADAYAARARELATKDMLKEALAIWENRAGLGEDIAFDPEHTALLLRMGRVGSVLDLFTQGKGIPPPQRDRLRSLLAAAYLAGADLVVERLPADDPVVLHATSARAVLAAYCAAEDKALQGALAAIPFRSPYRDWVQILKALQHLPDEPQAAAGLLARVGDESAFCRLRQAVQLALLPETSFLDTIAGADKPSVRFACTLRGWPQARIALWEELDRLGRDPRPETLLRFMSRHREALGAEWVRRRGLRFLIAGYPASRKRLGALGAGPLSAEENLLLAAWDAERREDLWGEQEGWERYARHLIREGPKDDPKTEHGLRIALTLRRCDQVADVLGEADPSADPENLDALLAAHLEESLTWDPDHRDTYLRLIGYYRRGKRRKDVRRLLEQACTRWPRDLQILEAALDIAIAAGSFKKAAGIAREMLALDSINSGVRERLVKAHLAHARKQVPKGRPDLARKELSEAREWARSAHAHAEIDLTAGLIALLEDVKTGAPALRDLVERLGGGLAGHLTLALAGEGLPLSLPKLFKQAGLGEPATPGRDDLLATLARLRTYLDGDGKITGELVAYLTPVLTDAPWHELSKGEVEAACETLRRCGLHQARLHAAHAALERWQGEPLFEFHAFEAKCPRDPNDCSDNDFERLEAALERAREEGDTRTARRIEKVFIVAGPMSFMPPAAGPVPPPGPEAVGAVIELLGLDKVMDMMGLPPEMKRDLKQVARQQGTEAVAEVLISLQRMASELTDLEDAPPIPRPPTGPKRGPSRR